MCQHHVQRHTRSFPGDTGERLLCLQHGWERDLSRTSLCLTPPHPTHTLTQTHKRTLEKAAVSTTAYNSHAPAYLFTMVVDDKGGNCQRKHVVDKTTQKLHLVGDQETGHKFGLTHVQIIYSLDFIGWLPYETISQYEYHNIHIGMSL